MRATHNFVFTAVMCFAIGFWTIASFRADAGAPVDMAAPQVTATLNTAELPVQAFDAI